MISLAEAPKISILGKFIDEKSIETFNFKRYFIKYEICFILRDLSGFK